MSALGGWFCEVGVLRVRWDCDDEPNHSSWDWFAWVRGVFVGRWKRVYDLHHEVL